MITKTCLGKLLDNHYHTPVFRIKINLHNLKIDGKKK